MATDPVPAQSAYVKASLSNNQQLADGLPSWTIYANPPGVRNMAGPRAQGSALYGREVNTPQGTTAGTPFEPTPSPQERGVGRQPFPVGPNIPGMQPAICVTPPPLKLMWEPSTYLPGTGWINSAKPNG